MFEPTGSLDDLVPEVRRHFDDLIDEAEKMGLDWWVGPRGVGRTCAQQDALDPAATSASGCQSWHVLGRAVDLQIKPWSCASYRRLGEKWESWGGFWGGRWTRYGPCGDAAHFHWPEGRNPGSPSSCPTGRAACEPFRQAYLEQAFTPLMNPLWAVALGLSVAGAVWWWRK